jgi:hypothetical protein
LPYGLDPNEKDNSASNEIALAINNKIGQYNYPKIEGNKIV